MGGDVYSYDGAGETLSVQVPRGATRTFFVLLQNDGGARDEIHLGSWRGRGLVQSNTQGGTSLPHTLDSSFVLGPGKEIVPIRVALGVRPSAALGTIRIGFRATSVHDPVTIDVVMIDLTVVSAHVPTPGRPSRGERRQRL